MRKVSFLCLLVLLLSQASCAVVKAGKSGGTDMKDFLQSETRGGLFYLMTELRYYRRDVMRTE